MSGYGSYDEERHIWEAFDARRRGHEANKEAREHIDAEIEARRVESAKRRAADDERRKNDELATISAELRAHGATEAEVAVLAPEIRKQRLLTAEERAEPRPLDYKPLL